MLSIDCNISCVSIWLNTFFVINLEIIHVISHLLSQAQDLRFKNLIARTPH